MRSVDVWFVFGFSVLLHSTTSQLQWKKINQNSFLISPSARKFASYIYDRDRSVIRLFGGLLDQNIPNNDLWTFDINTETWSETIVAFSPSPRFASCSGFHKGVLYVFGGCSSLDQCFNDLWRFDASTFAWEQLKPTSTIQPKARGFAACGISEEHNCFVISGGRSSKGNLLGDTFYFHIDQNRWFVAEAWQSVYDPGIPHPRAYHASVMISESLLMIMGGCLKHGSCPSPDSWIYDIISKRWVELPFCSYARSYGTMGILKASVQNESDFVVLHSGQIRSAQIIGIMDDPRSDEVILYDIGKNEWSIRQTRGQSPAPRLGAATASTPFGLYTFGGSLLNGTLLKDLYVLTGNGAKASTLRQCKTTFFTLLSLHGLFMFLAFGVFLQFGVAVAQYGSADYVQSERINWRYLHKFIQVVGVIFALCGFICGLASVLEKSAHFQSVHGGFGFFILCLLAVQAFIGFMKSKFSRMRQQLTAIHYWNGVFVLLTSFVNISLGLFLASVSSTLWILWFVFIFMTTLMLCIMHSSIFARK